MLWFITCDSTFFQLVLGSSSFFQVVPARSRSFQLIPRFSMYALKTGFVQFRIGITYKKIPCYKRNSAAGGLLLKML